MQNKISGDKKSRFFSRQLFYRVHEKACKNVVCPLLVTFSHFLQEIILQAFMSLEKAYFEAYKKSFFPEILL